MATFTLITGDPMEPTDSDLIAHELHLPMGESPPGHTGHHHDGWRILTGNVNFNLWARVAYRQEIEEMTP